MKIAPLKTMDNVAILRGINDPQTRQGPSGQSRGRDMTKSFLLAAGLAVLAGMAFAGPIERACNKSERKAATRSLCDCIQQAADMTLSGSDQRRAVSFFKDPEKAHKVWMSKSRGDDAFWDRYKAFGAQAEAMCGGGEG